MTDQRLDGCPVISPLDFAQTRCKINKRYKNSLND